VVAPEALDAGVVAIRGGAVRVVGYLSGILISLGAAVILVRHLGISDFGRYVTVTSLIALVGGVTEAGIALYGIREYVAHEGSSRQALIANLLGMRLALTVIGVGCAACFGLIAGYAHVLVIGTVVAGVGLAVQVVVDVLTIPLQVQLHLGRVTVVELVRKFLSLMLIGALALLGAGLLPFLAVAAISGIVALGLLVRMIRSSVRLGISWDWRRWRELFTETLPFAIAASIGAVYFYVTIIVMSLIASSIQTGFFATSFRVTQVALAIPAIALTAIFPLVTHQNGGTEAGLGQKMNKVLNVAVIYGVWMSLAMALGASFVINVIAGNSGHAAVSVLRIQGLVLTASFISASSMSGLLALRRYRPMLISSSCALILNVVLGLVLIPALGARGGALADVATETVMAFSLIVVLRRVVPGHAVTMSAIPPVLLAGAPSASVWLLPVGSIARVILASIIYFSVLALMGAIPEEMTSAIRRLPETLDLSERAKGSLRRGQEPSKH
jgi:O-antigen/teichoic acid export membrane protein